MPKKTLGKLPPEAIRLTELPRPPRGVYVTHGEPVAADRLRQAIEEQHGWPCTVPEHLQTFSL